MNGRQRRDCLDTVFDLVLPATTSSVVKRTWVRMYKFGEFARGKQAAQIAMTMGADTVRAVCAHWTSRSTGTKRADLVIITQTLKMPFYLI